MVTLSDQQKQDLIDHLNSTSNPHQVDAEQSDSVEDSHKSPALAALSSGMQPDADEVNEGTIVFVTDSQTIERAEKDQNGNWAWVEYPIGGSNNLSVEDVEDTVSQLVVEENLIDITYDDPNDELKFDLPEQDLMNEIFNNLKSDSNIQIKQNGNEIKFSLVGNVWDAGRSWVIN